MVSFVNALLRRFFIPWLLAGDDDEDGLALASILTREGLDAAVGGDSVASGGCLSGGCFPGSSGGGSDGVMESVGRSVDMVASAMTMQSPSS